MAVGDLKTDKGVEDLNSYLADRSYIEGWQPTQADVAVLEALGKAPTSSSPHVLRWYNHIKSYDFKSLPGEKKTPAVFSTAGAPASSAGKANDDDDDLDLFGSDEDEDAEAAKIREERLKAYAEKKSKKPAVIAKSSIVLDVKSWGDETDMKLMENAVRSIEMDGLVWGASQVISQVCLGCICEVSTGCNTTRGCSGSVCGPFAITWGYWFDAGKPTLNNEPISDDAYARCVNDPYCAAGAVQNYMAKFGHDCTGNGVIDCEDYLRIHRLGANACNGALNSKYENKFKLCLQTFQNQ